MKNKINDLATGIRVLRNPNKRAKLTTLHHLLLASTSALVLAALPAQAVNILVNPSFETPPYGHLSYPPAYNGWTYFSPPEPLGYFGDYWVVTGNDGGNGIYPHSGNYIWKEWYALSSRATNNVGGIYQTFNSAPGNTYQASGWFNIYSGDAAGPNGYIWLQVEFLDSSSNLLALYKSANFSSSVGENTWFQYQATNACDITSPVSLGNPWFNTYAITGAVSVITAPASTALVRYRYCYYAVAGDTGSSFLDDADLEQLSGPIPLVISNLYPQNMIFAPPSSGFTFNVTPSGAVNTNAIHLVLNGTDVSSSLTFSNFNGSWYATYNGLQSNSTYNASIYVTGSPATDNTHFETTWYGASAPTYVWEAEDWDFSNGMYIDFPALCNSCCESNCYFGVYGYQNVDENNATIGPYHFYRASDNEGTAPSGDYTRPNLYSAARTDYCINPFNYQEWVNYTRDWPNSTNWIIGRFANGTGSPGGATLYAFTPSYTNATATNLLGYFVVPPTASYSTFEYVYLQDTNFDGQNANVVLNGKETLQVVAQLPSGSPDGNGGNALPTFYMLVPAQVDLPFLRNLYPDGKHPFEPTNALSFTVTTAGATFPANGIQVILDGNDVSSNLVITGSASSNNVAYPFLQPNAVHTAIINVTNSLGHGISLTNQFDTFSQTNYMFEAEDYDFNSGQYIPSASYTPDSYASEVSVTNVDFHHTFILGETNTFYPYRINGIPQQTSTDYLRAEYISSFSLDYILIDYGPGDWANYTRDYPLGTFNVYARASGLGSTTMDLGQVVSGGGTTNQVVKPLGQFISTLPNIATFAWVPLTDSGGGAPVTVKISGVTTFQVMTPTGDCYPNYYMLVPTSPINLSASRSGNNINLTFPTQTGWGYRVFYRTNLATGSWTLLNSTTGNGSAQTVTDSSAGGSQRFYKVMSP